MKILLLGEFSAFHKNLSEGLIEVGVNVVTASNGDNWKKIDSNISWGSNFSGKLGQMEKLYKISREYKKFEGYDVVQLISPIIFPKQFNINEILINRIKENNKSLFLLGAGGATENVIITRFLKNKFKYPQLYKEIIKNKDSEWSLSVEGLKYNKKLHEMINGYIPIMYEYAQGYRDESFEKLKKTIPIPININKIKYRENNPKKKVVFFHGVTREGEKGTPLIRDAMLRLKEKYPRDVEINIVGNLPLSEYLDVTSRSNIIIDQAYSCSYGMNTAYNLALGKVCIGGGEPECLSEFGIDDSPLIPINANSDDIYNKMLSILERKKEIQDISYLSRQYAEKNHSHIDVAKKFLKAWEL
ncbi:glycosyltransferase [Photobacterium piscicola]|uniref:Glycosyltransferase n=1 Tax=Photobacterium piscicola TaxID=1378299 RepID=A0ABU6LE57_9GAMM|nr:glycosyltransferase [Photobacterium piscicola]